MRAAPRAVTVAATFTEANNAMGSDVASVRFHLRRATGANVRVSRRMNAELATRRARLGALLGSRAALLLASPPEQLRNGDVHYKFRQDSALLYLTGFEEPGTVALLRPT